FARSFERDCGRAVSSEDERARDLYALVDGMLMVRERIRVRVREIRVLASDTNARGRVPKQIDVEEVFGVSRSPGRAEVFRVGRHRTRVVRAHEDVSGAREIILYPHDEGRPLNHVELPIRTVDGDAVVDLRVEDGRSGRAGWVGESGVPHASRLT